MDIYTDKLRSNLEAAIRFKQELLGRSEQLAVFGQAVASLVECYKRGGRLYIAGNGGSCADAQHLATEFVSKLARPRAPLPAEALTADTTTLTAIGNDFGFDEIFARQLAGKASSGDMFLALTTSGQSRNLVRALEQCRQMKVKSIAFSGYHGGKVKDLADYCIVATGTSASTIQEVHQVLYHSLCECVEAALFPA